MTLAVESCQEKNTPLVHSCPFFDGRPRWSAYLPLDKQKQQLIVCSRHVLLPLAVGSMKTSVQMTQRKASAIWRWSTKSSSGIPMAQVALRPLSLVPEWRWGLCSEGVQCQHDFGGFLSCDPWLFASWPYFLDPLCNYAVEAVLMFEVVQPWNVVKFSQCPKRQSAARHDHRCKTQKSQQNGHNNPPKVGLGSLWNLVKGCQGESKWCGSTKAHGRGMAGHRTGGDHLRVHCAGNQNTAKNTWTDCVCRCILNYFLIIYTSSCVSYLYMYM